LLARKRSYDLQPRCIPHWGFFFIEDQANNAVTVTCQRPSRTDILHSHCAFPCRQLDSPAPIKVKVNGSWGEVTKFQLAPVLQDAAEVLASNFTNTPDEIFVFPREEGPIALFQPPGFIGLSSKGAYWAQHVYQFSHELCHVLTNYGRLQASPSKHFQIDEIVCETASQFTLLKLADKWSTSAPLDLGWFAPHLRKYANDLQAKYATRSTGLIYADPLHAATDRDKNGYVAVKLLKLFLEKPAYWQATQYYPPPTSTVAEFFSKWRNESVNREATDAIVAILAAEN